MSVSRVGWHADLCQRKRKRSDSLLCFLLEFTDASHVTMSAMKLLSRAKGGSKEKMAGSRGVVDSIGESEEFREPTVAKFEPDPLSEFAIVFAAMIHDVGHEGIPNFVLARERPALDAAAPCRQRPPGLPKKAAGLEWLTGKPRTVVGARRYSATSRASGRSGAPGRSSSNRPFRPARS